MFALPGLVKKSFTLLVWLPVSSRALVMIQKGTLRYPHFKPKIIWESWWSFYINGQFCKKHIFAKILQVWLGCVHPLPMNFLVFRYSILPTSGIYVVDHVYPYLLFSFNSWNFKNYSEMHLSHIQLIIALFFRCVHILHLLAIFVTLQLNLFSYNGLEMHVFVCSMTIYLYTLYLCTVPIRQEMFLKQKNSVCFIWWSCMKKDTCSYNGLER